MIFTVPAHPHAGLTGACREKLSRGTLHTALCCQHFSCLAGDVFVELNKLIQVHNAWRFHHTILLIYLYLGRKCTNIPLEHEAQIIMDKTRTIQLWNGTIIGLVWLEEVKLFQMQIWKNFLFIYFFKWTTKTVYNYTTLTITKQFQFSRIRFSVEYKQFYQWIQNLFLFFLPKLTWTESFWCVVIIPE